jgi:hypothetical protein
VAKAIIMTAAYGTAEEAAEKVAGTWEGTSLSTGK